ncbi:MAG: hypothetical protein K0S36_167 [Nitrosospira multiformis]|jgi:hypothetical protein|nr:hypothetical protein [Nitrosospira multiformis]
MMTAGLCICTRSNPSAAVGDVVVSGWNNPSIPLMRARTSSSSPSFMQKLERNEFVLYYQPQTDSWGL